MTVETPALEFVLGPSPARWDELEAPLALDPVTLEILRHKLEAINEEQAIALKEVSVSPIVTAASDFNNAIYTADGRIASMGRQVVFHSGAMPIVLRHVMDAFSAEEIADGDMFVVNDPFYGAVHHPDVSVVAPIFAGQQLIAWAGVAAHQVDMGGMSVGSISARAREKQQEGLMMPPIKLIERGRLREDVWRLILNMTRQPQMVGLDLRGFIASNAVARERMRELIDRYGAQTILTAMEELIRYSERRMRERLRELPDGVFRSRGFLDHDGIENRVYRTDIRLEKRGDVLRFDMRESSPQAATYINCTEGALVGAIFGGTAPILGAGIPWNHGILGALEVIAPKGLIVNARRPAATGAATIGQGWTIMSVASHAVSKLLACSEQLRRHSCAVTHGTFAALFSGDRNQHGEPYGTQLIDAQIGGGGASAVADGIDQSGALVAPRPHIANVETNEMHGPMLFLFRAFFPDTGGDGSFRGARAAGTAWTPHGVERLRNSLTSHGVEVPVSFGQFGGWPGVCNRQLVVRGSRVHELYAEGALPLQLDDGLAPLDLERLGGEVEVLEAKVPEFELVPGDVVLYTWQGGGGYGDPLERDPDLVRRDLELGLITSERARRAYGVPGDRSQLRSARLASADPPADENDGARRGKRLGPVGPALIVAEGAHGLQLECVCGSVLGSTESSWKRGCATRHLAGSDLPRGVIVHPALELVAYLCPSCGRQHGVAVEERGQPPLDDIRIGRWAG
ncbi:MAG: hydantoinase B/oxoprolinase family protein [Solirubrobacterales bacterium]|nr:hydantoinase B/oxoprolinase family protein [Solirubrobacterales bacterium]